MKQILIKDGKPLIKNIPDIDLEKGCVQIRVRKSCISIGTELRDISNS